MEREDIQKAAIQHANMIGWDHDPKEIRGLFAYSFEKGAEWQLQQLGHPDPLGEQGTDGTTIIKDVMKEKAIEAFNEAMIYFESPDCPTAKEALKHFIACLDQEPDSGCLEKPND